MINKTTTEIQEMQKEMIAKTTQNQKAKLKAGVTVTNTTTGSSSSSATYPNNIPNYYPSWNPPSTGSNPVPWPTIPTVPNDPSVEEKKILMDNIKKLEDDLSDRKLRIELLRIMEIGMSGKTITTILKELEKIEKYVKTGKAN